MPKDYKMSEQLFLDLWKEYGEPSELFDKDIIHSFLSELVKRSEGLVVLDHYSQINYDCIKGIEVEGRYTYIIWRDYSEYCKRYREGKLEDFEKIEWEVFGYAALSYLMLDINKIRFLRIRDHLYVLLQSSYIQQKEVKKHLASKGELIRVNENTNEFYTNYEFWNGPTENVEKHDCVVSKLPYYTCIIQPKENILATGHSTKIMLAASLNEVIGRMKNVENELNSLDPFDSDRMFSLGNLIRRILEFTLKYFCAVLGIAIDVEQKYPYIELGDLKKAVSPYITIEQPLINMANILSHDSGYNISKDELSNFLASAAETINKLNEIILKHQ